MKIPSLLCRRRKIASLKLDDCVTLSRNNIKLTQIGYFWVNLRKCNHGVLREQKEESLIHYSISEVIQRNEIKFGTVSAAKRTFCMWL